MYCNFRLGIGTKTRGKFDAICGFSVMFCLQKFDPFTDNALRPSTKS